MTITKKLVLLIAAIALLLAACGGSGAETPTATPTEAVPIEAVEDPLPVVPPQDILGLWMLNPEQSTFGGSTMLDPLEAEILETGWLEITDRYVIVGDFGHTYSWIDDQRIRLNGVMVGFGTVTDGFFHVFTVQHDGDLLRLLISDGTPFAVLTKGG